MNKKTNKYIYEFANEQDGEKLAELLEKTSFDGDFSLAYARRPNVFDSLKKESEKFVIVICRNTQNRNLHGMGMCSINKMLVNGKSENIAYLSGFRRAENTGGRIIDMYHMLNDFCKENNVKYTYTTILEDNIHAQKMFTKKRRSMPDYIKISDYTVNIFKSKLKCKSNYTCEKVTEKDFNNLKKFVEKESKNKIFFPNIDLNNNFFDLSYQDFFVLKDSHDEICACGVLWNQTGYKQLVVKNYSLKYKIIRSLSNWILKLLNFPTLPKIDEIVDYSTLSFVLCKNNKNEYLNEFIKHVSHKVKEKMFVYSDTKELSENITPMKYKSGVYLVDWNKNFDKKEFDTNKLYIECALL